MILFSLKIQIYVDQGVRVIECGHIRPYLEFLRSRRGSSFVMAGPP